MRGKKEPGETETLRGTEKNRVRVRGWGRGRSGEKEWDWEIEEGIENDAKGFDLTS